jgi:hypothetical protein
MESQSISESHDGSVEEVGTGGVFGVVSGCGFKIGDEGVVSVLNK